MAVNDAFEDSPLLSTGRGLHNDNGSDQQPSNNPLSSAVPHGRYIEASPQDRTLMFVGIIIVGWSYGLDALVRENYHSFAASELGVHSQMSTLNTVRSVVAAITYLPAARLSDSFGRLEVMIAASILYLLGTAIESLATSFAALATGAAIYQIGYTCIILLVEVIVADLTSTRSRVLFSYAPALPFLVNTWISGALAAAVLKSKSWQRGIGMWCFIYAVSAVPLLVGLYRSRPRRVQQYHDKWSVQMVCKKGLELCHLTDLVGSCLGGISLAALLVPLTVVDWDPSTQRLGALIASTATGALAIPAFILWETRVAQTPIIPGHLLKNRNVLAGLAVRFLLNVSWATQSNYLMTVLIVAFDFSVAFAIQVATFFTFFGVLAGLVVGFAIYRVQHIKPFIVIGTILFTVSLGIMAIVGGGMSKGLQITICLAQVLIGIASGFCAYPTQAVVQIDAGQDYTAAATGMYMATFNIGNALGTSVAGIIWSHTLLDSLLRNLAFQSDASLAESVYRSPFEAVRKYPPGTAVRTAIVSSYSTVETVLCTTSLAFGLMMVCAAWTMRNAKVSNR